MIINNQELYYQLFKHEECLNGYYHLVQKKLHGIETKHPYVGLKDYHIKHAQKLGTPIMIHLCPNVSLSGTGIEKEKALKACNYKDQTEVMVIRPEHFYLFRFSNMKESKSRDEEGNIREFTPNRYQVWHYLWKPDYIEGEGIKRKTPTTEQLGLF